jgi:polar amino acid transport system substrate-binding protein
MPFRIGFHAKTVLTIVALVSAGMSSASADRLDEIKARGKVVCATLTTSMPGGFQDPKTRKIVGFDVDLCTAIAKGLGVEFVHKGVTVDQRIPELQLDRVDLVAAGLGYTKERAEQIAYTHSHYQHPIRMLVKKESPYQKLAELDGKRISAIRGSTSELFTRKKLPHAELVTFADSPTSYLAMMQGKTQGVALTTIASIRYINDPKQDIRVLDEAVGWEPAGVGIKKGEDRLLAAVNKILENLEASGQLEEIWQRWYGPKTEFNLPRVKKLTPISELDDQ